MGHLAYVLVLIKAAVILKTMLLLNCDVVLTNRWQKLKFVVMDSSATVNHNHL